MVVSRIRSSIKLSTSLLQPFKLVTITSDDSRNFYSPVTWKQLNPLILILSIFSHEYAICVHWKQPSYWRELVWKIWHMHSYLDAWIWVICHVKSVWIWQILVCNEPFLSIYWVKVLPLANYSTEIAGSSIGCDWVLTGSATCLIYVASSCFGKWPCRIGWWNICLDSKWTQFRIHHWRNVSVAV